QRQHAGPAPDNGNRKIHKTAGDARPVKNRSHQHKHGNGQQGILCQPCIEVLRHGQKPIPVCVQIGQYDGECSRHAQRDTDRGADQHQHRKRDEQQRRDHGRLRSRRCSMPATRSAIPVARIGIHIEYHHVGMPIAGDVSPQLYSSYTMRAESTASKMKNRSVTRRLTIASLRWRVGEPPSANSSMRICWLRTNAVAAAVSVSRISRKMDISSVQANEPSVKYRTSTLAKVMMARAAMMRTEIQSSMLSGTFTGGSLISGRMGSTASAGLSG